MARFITLELTDWDNDLPSEADEEYQALVRTLKFTEGFGLLFVRCSPADGEQVITKVTADIGKKNIQVLRLEKAVNNLYEIIEQLENKEQIKILFITGLEHSFYKYEECKALAGWNSREIYSYSWKSVPHILINLNQQREHFRDNFNICFVFLLPQFAIKYFIQRAPDFFDWRSGLFDFPINAETLEQESLRHSLVDDYEKQIQLSPEERNQKIIEIQEIIAEDHQIPESQYDLLCNLGRLQAAGQDYKQAIASFDQGLKVNFNYHEAWNNRGVVLCDNLQWYEEAITSFNEVLKIQPDDYQAWNNQGIALRKLGRNEEAIASFDKALEFKPDDHQAWDNRGIALRNLGRNEEAIASFDRALEFKPDDHQAWNNRGIALFNLGRYEQAIASFDKALEFQPDDHDVWSDRGIALGNLGRYEEALASFDKALAIQPDDHQAWNNRGYALGNLGRYEEALASYDRALEFQPDDHDAWNNRGIALGNLGRYEEALASFDKALAIQPDDHQAWNNRGIALRKFRTL